MNEYSTLIGMDLGDKVSHYAVMTREETEIQSTGTVRTTEAAMRRLFGAMEPCCVTIEAGTHSPWVSRLLEECGHEVLVANPRRTRAIYDNPNKTDRADAEMLARLLRSDPNLLSPIRHNRKEEQSHLAIVKARDALVRVRTTLINTVRGLVKSMGQRLPSVSAEAFHRAVADLIPQALNCAVKPLVKQIGELTRRIHSYDKVIETLSHKHYPECQLLQSVPGVGPVTAVAFRLVLGDPSRFRSSRSVGPYLGLTRRKDDSGEHHPELPITKAGNPLIRRLLVGSAQYILGPLNRTDSELRQWGLKLAGPPRSDGRPDRKAKKRAVVAVARKLGVLLHTLWVTGAVYEPFFHDTRMEAHSHDA